MQATVCPEMIQLKAPQRTQAAVREAARDPLSAAPARSELPDLIRRPAFALAGRGHLS